MAKRFHFTSLFSAILICLVLVLVSACSPLPGSGGSGTPTTSAGNGTPGGNGSTPTPQTVQMPPTQTGCPAADTARAAVMRTLVLGNLQNLVYIYNEVPQNTSTSIGHLRRYDVSNGHKANLVDSGLRIDQAQISADGQWVLFLSVPDPRGDSQHSAMLQLVRMDGQGLQTLYCFPNLKLSGQTNSNKLPIAIQWSVDEKSILVSVNTNNTTSQIFLLDVASGTIRQLFLDQNDTLYDYSVMTWLDNTHFYVIKQGLSGPTPPATVYLMDASTATVASPGLVKILTTPTRMSYYSLDSSYDGKLLYTSYCLLAASPFTTNIQVGPATGGARNTIFQEKPDDCVQTLRAISANTLLLLVQVAKPSSSSFTNQIWKMSLPGNSMQTLTKLTTVSSSQTGFSLNPTSQLPWSNVARDGSYYVVQAVDPVATTQSILVGSTNGGDVIPVATTNPGSSTVSIVGWTTL